MHNAKFSGAKGAKNNFNPIYTFWKSAPSPLESEGHINSKAPYDNGQGQLCTPNQTFS